MLEYEIARWHSPLRDRAADFAKVRQGPAAAARTWAAIHDMLAGEAMLDTPRAWQLKAEFEADEAAGTFTPPARGYLRHKVYRLRANDRLGAFVEYQARRA